MGPWLNVSIRAPLQGLLKAMKDTRGALSFRAVMKKEHEMCVVFLRMLHPILGLMHGTRALHLQQEGHGGRGSVDPELHSGCEGRR